MAHCHIKPGVICPAFSHNHLHPGTAAVRRPSLAFDSTTRQSQFPVITNFRRYFSIDSLEQSRKIVLDSTSGILKRTFGKVIYSFIFFKCAILR